MLTIAICDDEPDQLLKAADALQAYLQQRPSLSGHVAAFRSGQELLAAAKARSGFDLYILDIIMPDLNGIETGMRLRELGSGGEIIYLTTSNDFAADSYETQAFFYLLKPVGRDKLFAVLDDAVKKLFRQRSEGIIIPVHGGMRRLLFDQILYAERVRRVMRYYCDGEAVDSLTIRGSFREMAAPLLADRRFCPCGPSFVFNLQHITGISGQLVRLDTGAQIPVPRRAVLELKAAWGKFWLDGADNL